MTKINLIDCTLRDGGYYNSWDFSQDLIEEYLLAMSEINVDFVEIGLRSLNVKGYKGACAYSTDGFLQTLSIPDNVKICVMINASELISDNVTIESALDQLFSEASESSVELVRVACHFEEFLDALPAATWLSNKGYKVGFNIMQIANREEKEIQKLVSAANQFPIDVLYFADSLGGLDNNSTNKIVNTISDNWSGDIGIHAHDNMGLALSNTLSAINQGVTWVDSTVTGMGRGPGNVKTELIVLEIMNHKKVNILGLMNLIENKFNYLKEDYGWGTNPYYYLSGKYGVHPTYVQEMLNDNRYNNEDIITLINFLADNGGSKFRRELMDISNQSIYKDNYGEWIPRLDVHADSILIIGSGPSIIKHKQAINKFIEVHLPYVITLNGNRLIDDKLVNLKVITHPLKYIAEKSRIVKNKSDYAIPLNSLELDKDNVVTKRIKNYGLVVNKSNFEIKDTYAILPNSLAATYALAIAASTKSPKIYLVGFDGYGKSDLRNDELNRMFDLFKQNYEQIELISLTPTEYNLTTTSIYSQI